MESASPFWSPRGAIVRPAAVCGALVVLFALSGACGGSSGSRGGEGVTPQITSVTPPRGPVSGGTPVTVIGSGINRNTAVLFSVNNGQSVTYISPTELQVEAPPGALGPVDVTLVNPGNLTSTLPGGFTYIPNILQEALGLMGMNRRDFGWEAFDYSWLPREITSDPFRLSFYNVVHDISLDAPEYFQGLVDDTDLEATGPNPVSNLIEYYADMLDRPVAANNPTWRLDPAEPLAEAVADLITAWGMNPNMTAILNDASDIPLTLQIQVAEIVLAITDATLARDAAFASLAQADIDFFYDYLQGFVVFRADTGIPNPAWQPNKDFLNDTVPYGYLYQAGYDLARTIENLAMQADPAYVGFSFNQQTPMGRIIIGDNSDHTYDPGDPAYSGDIALVVDTGGSDTYMINAGGSTATAPISVALDLSGNDFYEYVVVSHPDDTGTRLPSDSAGRASFGDLLRSGLLYGPVSLSDTPRQGGGRLGVGLLFDYGAGADSYRSLRMSQGWACMGVGALLDDGGDDTYAGECGVQGSGIFGIGILVDGGGFDMYESYNSSQGFGYVRGAGVLFDLDGDDSYWAEDGADPIYYTPQDPGRSNTSFCQGAGFGLRFERPTLIPPIFEWWSGGIGVLRDVSGADTYWASIFAQGTGYWYGTGLLADSGGDDFYDAKWYVQAGAAHFAMALLLDGGGNDTYNSMITPMNVTLGSGHDYSLGIFIDESGNDSYRGAGLSFGAGNVNGMGLFVDNAGTDVYNSIQDNAMGSATADIFEPERQIRPTIGFFLEGDTSADVDTYIKPAGNVGNDMSWTQFQGGVGIELGVGVDRSDADTTLHFR